MKRTATTVLKRVAPKAPKATFSAAAAIGLCVLDLGDDLVPATVVCRPSARNRSPYVGDVELADGRVAIAHMPSMDMGGKCCAGAAVLMRPNPNPNPQPLTLTPNPNPNP